MNVPGYTYGSAEAAPSPVTADELAKLEQSIGWTPEDAQLLQKHADLFRARAERMVHAWRGIIASQPHLAASFLSADGKPDEAYKARAGSRLVQWVVDVVTRPHDRDWLNYQEEIGLRHAPEKKNRTDGASAAPFVPLRYLVAFIAVITPLGEYLGDAIPDPAELAALEHAWMKAATLHVTLWARPYVIGGLW